MTGCGRREGMFSEGFWPNAAEEQMAVVIRRVRSLFMGVGMFDKGKLKIYINVKRKYCKAIKKGEKRWKNAKKVKNKHEKSGINWKMV